MNSGDWVMRRISGLAAGLLTLASLALVSGCVIKPATPEGIAQKCAELRAEGKRIPDWCPVGVPPPPPPPPPPPDGDTGADRPPR